MSAPPPARAVYLEHTPDPVFGLYHAPARGSRPEVAVLICPPFGWDDVCSYRSRRDWAQHLAAAGHPTLRIDLPGAGDSGGTPRDPARLAAWVAAVSAAAGRLRVASDCRRVAAIGIGLGGLVACQAVARGASIDDVVLWAVPARGRTLVRELRALARLKAAGPAVAGAPEPPPLPDGFLEAAGFVLSAETVRALEDLDLTALPLPGARARRVLALERDGIPVDARLRRHLEEAGAAVTVAPGAGYGAMMAHPQDARPPTEVFARVTAWLAETAPSALAPLAGRVGAPSAPAASGVAALPGCDEGFAPPVGWAVDSRAEEPSTPADSAVDPDEHRDAIELTAPSGRRIRETALTVEQPFGGLFGVLAEPVGTPAADVCAVILNGGALRRIGPNRMWVELARRWAARGVPTLRLDLEGIGDADGDADRYADVAALYVPELVDQARAALDVLGARGLPRRFVLVGLCSGAFWAFHAALRDERVTAALMLNVRALFWDDSLETVRDVRRVGRLLQRSSWGRIRRGEVRHAQLRTIARWALLAPVRAPHRGAVRRARGDELDWALDRLRDTDTRAVLAFSDGEPLHWELEREGRLARLDRWPNLELHGIPGRDHTFRSVWLQQHVHALLDEALDRELVRTVSRSDSARTSAGAVS